MPDQKIVNGVTVREVEEMNELLSGATLVKGSGFVWPNRAEYMITFLGDHPYMDRSLNGKIFKEEGENAITYRVGQASKEFMAYVLCALVSDEAVQRPARWAMMRRRAQMLADPSVQERGRFAGTSLLDVVQESFPVATLQIESPTNRTDFEALATSFLFQAAYNLDVAARLSNGLEHLIRGTRIQRVRRVGQGEFDAPRQIYKGDLVQHYLMGVAAELPLLEYLAFYHIAEHYFEKVFNDDLVDQVRAAIVDPSFSVRRTKDVQRVIKVVTKVQRQIREEGGVNEQRALQLVIEKFVDTNRLVRDIEAYDSHLLEYYKENEVSFAEACKVDLSQSAESGVSGAIAKRIYKVRNALVHAKEGALPKYAPFVHDAELSKEVPLMRFIAEQIIISHGRIM